MPAAPATAAPKPPRVEKPSTRHDTTRGKRFARQRQQAAKAVRFAYAQIGDRYRYGGTGPSNWDCSGLAGGAWRYVGISLPRTTYAIYGAVRRKVAYNSLRPGDLVFFYSSRGHMGIYVGGGYMIHAPSSGKRVQKVRLSGYYSRNLNGAVRPAI